MCIHIYIYIYFFLETGLWLCSMEPWLSAKFEGPRFRVSGLGSRETLNSMETLSPKPYRP